MGMRDDSGNVVAAPIPNTKAATLTGFIRQHVAQGATVVTGQHNSCTGLIGYRHLSVNHSVGEYVRDMAHTNGIESFWALLKRGYYGIFHCMSRKHLHRYVSEFALRHNTSNLSTMEFIKSTARRISGKRLTCKELVNG